MNIIRFILEDLIPPILRDSRGFYYLLYLIFGKNTPMFATFRSRAPYLSAKEYEWYYREMKPILQETDLNQRCIDQIQKETVGGKVIDVGCGRGFLVNFIRSSFPKTEVFGADLVITDQLRSKCPQVTLVQAPVEQLPFKDGEFDTVICTHTLEHIVHFETALRELRRICKSKLILVVPREREYLYAGNFHVNFFPYVHSFLNRLHPLPKDHRCEVLDGDIFYSEIREP